MQKLLSALSAFAILAVSCPAQEKAQPTTETSAAPQITSESRGQYGVVHFPISCSPEAQKQFDHAVTLLHSFFYPETVKAFTEVAEIDPTCAMAYWGIAISQLPNPLVGPFDAPTLRRGMEAVQKGESLHANTQREADWLKAADLFFRDADKLDQMKRTGLYAEAMERLYLRYPEDTEAAVFYALALNESAMLSNKNYTNQLKAAAILEKLALRQPDHPGIAHYLIHTYDYQPLAAKGLAAANKYAGIAPSAPHALHMPSHIYSMLGMWEDSIKSNQTALSVAKAYAAKNYSGAADPSELHCLDFLEYDYLQLGQDKLAKAIVEEAAAITNIKFIRMTVDTAMAAIPARYALERGAWREASELQLRPSNYGYAQAITYFARALGAARTGNSARAREDIEHLDALHKAYLAKPDDAYWADQTWILSQAASSCVARAEGRGADGLKLLRLAADQEDKSEKHVAMENRLYPMREFLAYMLLELNEPRQALREFESSLSANPNRWRGIYGAARAAELSGDKAAARGWYEKLVTLARQADGDRAELRDAKHFLAGHH